MDPSKFRHLVVLQDYVEVVSELGQPKQVFSDIDQFFASIEQLAGSERALVTQIYAEATHLVGCRDPGYRITPVMRFCYTDIHEERRIFNILAAKSVDERGMYYEITCKEVYKGV